MIGAFFLSSSSLKLKNCIEHMNYLILKIMLWVFCRCSCFFSASGIQTSTFYGGGVLEQASSVIVFIYLFMINPIVQLKDVGFETQCDPGLRETRGLWHRVWAGTCRGWATISKTVLTTYYTHTADVPSRKGETSARSTADLVAKPQPCIYICTSHC